MADYSKLAIYDMNSYLWQKLQDASLFNSKEYYVDELQQHLIPIIPAQQIPEFNNLLPGKSYIVYDYEIKPTMENWWISEEIITYSILSQNYDHINKIINFLSDTFRRYDEAAKDIRNYFEENSQFEFHFSYIDKAVSPEYFKSEGGFQMGIVEICISYARKLDSSGRFQ